jgi:hypothetical protein
LKHSDEKKTYPLPGTKENPIVQVDESRNYYPTSFNFAPLALLSKNHEKVLLGTSLFHPEALAAALRRIDAIAAAAAAKLPPTSCCRAAAAAAPPFLGWLLHCCPPSDFVIACRHATINALIAGCFRR